MPPGNPGGYAGPESPTMKRQRKKLKSRGSSARDDRADRADRNIETNRQARESGNGPGSSNTSETVPELIGSDYLTPRSDFGQQFKNSAMFPDMLANPDVLATAWMGQNGITPQNAGGMQKVFNDLAAVMPQLFYLTQGGGSPESGSLPAFIDYADEFLKQYSGSGGVISPSVGMNVLNASGNSPLAALINNPNLDPAGQAQTVTGLLGSSLATSMPGGVASSIMGQAEQLAREWMAQQAQQGGTNPVPFTEFLKSKGFGDYFQ